MSLIVTSVPWMSVTVAGRVAEGFSATGCSAESARSAVEGPSWAFGSVRGVTSASRTPLSAFASSPPCPSAAAQPLSASESRSSATIADVRVAEAARRGAVRAGDTSTPRND